MIHVFAHNDFDGRCSAAIVNKKFPGQCMFHELDYKDPVPIEHIQPGDSLIIVDFSLKPEVMEKVFKKISDITHIDHHITAFEYNYGRELAGIRKEGESGCLLTWKYYFPDDPIPVAVLLIDDFDCWKLKRKGSIPFIEGLRLEDTSPTSKLWNKLLDPRDVVQVGRVVEVGKICVEYRKSICEEYAASFGWETELAGHKAYACGLYKFGSLVFGSRMQKYDLCLSYEYLGDGTWTIGAYTNKENINVGEICKEQGKKYNTTGGGHRGAGGWIHKGETLPFKKINSK